MTAQPVTLGNGQSIFDAAFATVVGVCEALPMIAVAGVKAAGSVGGAALAGIDNAVGAMAEATTPPAANAAPAPDFAAMLQGCGTLNLGISESRKGVSLQEECDVNPGVTGQLSAANFFGKTRESSPAMSA
jgi:hypothetical protein